MFLIAAGVLAGGVTIGQFVENMIFVWSGNLVGGGVILAGMYFLAFKVGMKPKTQELENDEPSSIIVEEK